MKLKIYVCHQGRHIHTTGHLVDCQARKMKLPELTLDKVEISTVEEYGQSCYNAGYHIGVESQYDAPTF